MHRSPRFHAARRLPLLARLPARLLRLLLGGLPPNPRTASPGVPAGVQPADARQGAHQPGACALRAPVPAAARSCIGGLSRAHLPALRASAEDHWLQLDGQCGQVFRADGEGLCFTPRPRVERLQVSAARVHERQVRGAGRPRRAGSVRRGRPEGGRATPHRRHRHGTFGVPARAARSELRRGGCRRLCWPFRPRRLPRRAPAASRYRRRALSRSLWSSPRPTANSLGLVQGALRDGKSTRARGASLVDLSCPG